ncbi:MULTISPECIES: rhamnan synthesis F family protein [Inquilinus]|uniref:Uncharacterized protein n=1 Tax=Inquilinus ginsengisoli TaxID=363840 RepID=A0ABU1JSD6_9PROT|nr:rhamnan synthesis F family protein [Inquilinus ginsengisoli]MDR6291541.1 hypothetical protein [Inquilinus ginsengisoli]
MRLRRRSLPERLRRSVRKRWRRLRGLPALPTKASPPLRQADPRMPGAATAWLDIVRPYAPAEPPREVALFVTHSRNGRTLRRHVGHYVRALQAEGVAVVLIVAADTPDIAVPEDLARSLAGLYIRQNLGFDFAAWAHVMQRELAVFRSDALYLVNDSLYGPFNAVDFGALMARIRAAGSDIVGLTESHDKGWHLQSFFLCLKRSAFSHPDFHHFWQDVRAYPDKQDVIDLYEVAFCGRMRDAGLACAALFENPTRDNQTAFAWRELIDRGFPFIKSAVLSGALPPAVVREGWEAALAARGYDIGLVDEAPAGDPPPASGLTRTRRRRALAERLRADPAPLRLAYIGPWTHAGAAGEAGRDIVAALFHTGHEINLHPLERDIGADRRLSPAWDVRSFDGAPDAVLIQLESATLDEEQQALCESATIRIGLWDTMPAQVPVVTVDAVWPPRLGSGEAISARLRDLLAGQP